MQKDYYRTKMDIIKENDTGFITRDFQEIPLIDWYGISQLREKVFIVDQNCVCLDADGHDIKARHVYQRDEEGAVVAYARIVHPTDSMVEMSKLSDVRDRFWSEERTRIPLPAIGRVVLEKSERGTGKSRLLMRAVMEEVSALYPGERVFLSAQKPLRSFYESFGFLQSGPEYSEVGIPHLPMIFPG